MIPDWQKNHVYFSGLLPDKYPDEFELITDILKRHAVKFELLDNTKDIWCRDYMPVEVYENNLIQFSYQPSYLKGRLDIQTNPNDVNHSKKQETTSSSINLDGGNVVCSPKKVILTNRVFIENPSLSEVEISNKLAKLFNSEVYFVPSIKTDLTGHIDGHLRFVDDETIIVNELENELKYWQVGFKKMIKLSGLNYIEMPWFMDSKDKEGISAIGSYLNYLHLKDLIIFPIFNHPLDVKALEIIKTNFPNTPVEPININKIAKQGGLMNCITWTTK